MQSEPESQAVQYVILASIGAGAFGFVQYVLVLLRESVDPAGWNGNLAAMIAHPIVFALASAILSRRKIGHPLLNSVALLLVPFVAAFPGYAGFPIGPMAFPALLLSFGVSIVVFTISHHKPSSVPS